MNDLIQSGSFVAIIIALNSMLSQYIEKKYIPLVSVFLGIGGSLLIGGFSIEMGMQGLIFGLMACGLYDQKKVFSK